jgi:CheY-like chemotaxis protein
MKTMIIPSLRGAISCSHEITDIAEERDDARLRPSWKGGDKVIAAPICKSRAGLTGCRALNALAKDRFEMVLTDIHMPGLDGAEAFKRLRNPASVNRLAPVIALTADPLHGDRGKFLARGVDGYVSRPADERSLVTAITQTLSLPDEVTRTMLQTG